VSATELIAMIRKSAQSPKIFQGRNYERVDTGKIVEIDATTDQETSIFTIITNKTGDLIIAFPGRTGKKGKNGT